MKKFLLLSFMLTFAFAIGESWAQERTVSGKVTSIEDGSALPGVNVVLKGTTTGTVTDIDGNYKLSVPSEGGTLVFSFIGLTTEEVAVGSRSVIDVQLSPDVQQLSEVVVTAFGVERQKNELTYATERVTGDDINVVQQTTATQGLVGKVAGMQINVQNNGVKPSSQILLRGLRSITNSNDALIVIDGVIATKGTFDNLNPNDIASVDVLKGANAAVQYGSDAANGVLVVTTKKGGNKLVVGLNSSFQLEEVAFMPDFQTEYGIGWDGHYDPIENTNWGPRFDGVTRRIGPILPDGTFQAVPYAPIQDNLKDFYEKGKTFQNTVYVSGGDETSKFYLSLGRQNTSGIVPEDEYERTSLKVNASKTIGKVDLAVNTTYFKDKTDVVGNTIGDQDRNLYWFVLNTPANIPLTNYKDWQNPDSWAHADRYYNAYYQNPYWAIGTNRDIDETSRFFGNISVGYKITDNISWTSKLGVNSAFGNGKNWRARQEYDPELQPSHSNVSSFVEDFSYQQTDFNGSSIVSADYDINEDFSIKGMVGAAFIQEDYRENEIRANNLSIPGFYDISNSSGQLVGTVDESQYRNYGFFGEITAGYKDWAFISLTGRQDYTSTLSKENNSYFYPGIGATVILSDAVPALQDNDLLSFLKVSVSNSTVYNDLPPYLINERYNQPATFPLAGGINGFALNNMTVDENITKEKISTNEITLDLGLFNDRVTLNSSVYQTRTFDLITETTPSTASGATIFLTNIGELKGTGLEVTLGGTVVKAGDFKWKMNVNYTTTTTEVVEIKEDLKEVGINVVGGYGTFAIVDLPFPQLKAASYVRDPQGRVVVDAVSGDPLVGDVLAMGRTTPEHVIGTTSEFSWKGISLSATIDYRTGHVYYEQGSDLMEFTGRSIASVSSDRQDFVWPNSVIETSEGVFVENTNIPITNGVMGFWQNKYNEIKENYVKDATALKIREVAIRYTFPRSLLDKTKVINKLTLGLVSRNTLTFLPEENRFSDPEFNNQGGGSNNIGVGGYLQSPPTRTFGFNLNIEF